MKQNSDYFNSPDYLAYLRLHCGSENIDASGRVAGSSLAIDIIALMEIQPGETVLEIGCGVGRILHQVKAVFNCDVLGCDISQPAILHLRANDPVLSTRVYCCPSDRIDFVAAATLDHVITWGVFELTDQRRTLIELARILKKGGRALLGSVKSRRYHRDDVDSRAAHEAYVTKQIPISFSDVTQLETLLAYLGFHIVKRVVFEYKGDLTDGDYRVDMGGDTPFAEAMYVIEKISATPLELEVSVNPTQIQEKV